MDAIGLHGLRSDECPRDCRRLLLLLLLLHDVRFFFVACGLDNGAIAKRCICDLQSGSGTESRAVFVNAVGGSDCSHGMNHMPYWTETAPQAVSHILAGLADGACSHCQSSISSQRSPACSSNLPSLRPTWNRRIRRYGWGWVRMSKGGCSHCRHSYGGVSSGMADCIRSYSGGFGSRDVVGAYYYYYYYYDFMTCDSSLLPALRFVYGASQGDAYAICNQGRGLSPALSS